MHLPTAFRQAEPPRKPHRTWLAANQFRDRFAATNRQLQQIVADARHFFALSSCRHARVPALRQAVRGRPPSPVSAPRLRGGRQRLARLCAPRLQCAGVPAMSGMSSTPGSVLRMRRVISPPAQSAMLGGSCRRSVASPSPAWRTGNAAENDSATTCASCASAARRMSSIGVCTPSEMHCAPSGTSNASTISRPDAVLLAGERRHQHRAARPAAAGTR